MKQPVILLTFFVLFLTCYESKAQFQLGVGMDVYKTDNIGFGRKNQFGIEGNYFLTHSFALLGGIELWSAGPNGIIALGGRWYIANPVFLKIRGLLSSSADVSLGMGYTHSLDRNWKLDFGGDYFYNGGDLALRIGLGYRFK